MYLLFKKQLSSIPARRLHRRLHRGAAHVLALRQQVIAQRAQFLSAAGQRRGRTGEHLIHVHARLRIDAVRIRLRAFARLHGIGLRTAGNLIFVHQLLRLLLGGKDQLLGAGLRVCDNRIGVLLRAAAGLNLQRATCVVFGELDWSPAVHSQAEDRAHRMGQTDSVLCYYLVASEGSDQDMQDALGLKVSQFVGLMGDAPQEQADVLNSAQEARSYVERLVKRLTQAV